MGTTTVTSYVESGAGVKAGGKTGMTSLIIGLLFLACIFFAPLATSLPKQIDGGALLFVSVLFIRNITDIEWDDISESAIHVVVVANRIDIGNRSSVNDVIGVAGEELVATGVGIAVVVLAADTYHVKASRRGRSTV